LEQVVNGKLQDEAHLSPQAAELFNEWIGALRSLRDPGSSRQALSHIYAFPYYFRDYKFKPWQLMAFPRVTTKIWLLKRQLRNDVVLSDSLMIRAEALLSEIEFGKHSSSLSYLDRQRIRKAVYINMLSAWQLRQAFNSFAAKSKSQQIQFKSQPAWIFPIAMTLQYLLGLCAVMFFLLLSYDVFVESIITFDLAWPAFLHQLAIIGTFVMHRLGQQWKNGEEVLGKLKLKS
jgi:hypothetical protein